MQKKLNGHCIVFIRKNRDYLSITSNIADNCSLWMMCEDMKSQGHMILWAGKEYKLRDLLKTSKLVEQVFDKVEEYEKLKEESISHPKQKS